MADNTTSEDDQIDPRLAAEESLNAALNDLEQILDQRSNDADRNVEPNPVDDPQLSIPLLDDVVVPGILAEDRQQDLGPSDNFPLSPPLSADADFRKVVDRLASELDVIIQTRVETAMREVSRDIKSQIRTHIDIILPEVLEELAEINRSRS